jgi:hypothetical protein
MTSPIPQVPLVRILQSFPFVKSVIADVASWSTTDELDELAETTEEMELTSPMLDKWILRARDILALAKDFGGDDFEKGNNATAIQPVTFESFLESAAKASRKSKPRRKSRRARGRRRRQSRHTGI